ncbi:MAG: hypothetical protein K6T86_08760 [Pirellulales bacterium]|nr:hypothetical protein [Pirellulales bacterium]
MRELRRQVRRAQWRLAASVFLKAFAWTLFGALLAASVLVGLQRLGVMRLAVPWESWPAGAVAAALAAACGWTLLRRVKAIDAAMEVDRRFGLRERVSSSLALTPEQLASPAGQALLADAVRRVEKLYVPEQFPIKVGSWALLPAIPVLILAVVVMFVHPTTAVGAGAKQATTAKAKPKKQIKKQVAAKKKRLEAWRKRAEQVGLKDAEQIFSKLQSRTTDIPALRDEDRKQTLVKLNDLSRQLQQRREALAAGESLKQQLQQLRNVDQGPGDKMLEALRQGDMATAKRELDRLAKDLAEGKLDSKQQAALGKQLAQLKQKLQEMVKAHQQAKAAVEQKLAEAKARGDEAEANRLKQQLDKLAKQQASMQKLDKLAQQLGQAANALKQGDASAAKQAMQSLQQQMEQMQQELQEAELLDQALSEIEQAKEQLTCNECGGEGCKACQGGMRGQAQGRNKRLGGMGMGAGRGQGPRPESPTKTGERKDLVKQKYRKGAAIFAGDAEGPNTKGRIEQEINLQFEQVESEEADPLTSQDLPKGYSKHAQEYFDKVRKGGE